MMAPFMLDLAAENPEHGLAQFEPDPDGDGGCECASEAIAAYGDADWIVWASAEDESAWAAGERWLS